MQNKKQMPIFSRVHFSTEERGGDGERHCGELLLPLLPLHGRLQTRDQEQPGLRRQVPEDEGSRGNRIQLVFILFGFNVFFLIFFCLGFRVYLFRVI